MRAARHVPQMPCPHGSPTCDKVPHVPAIQANRAPYCRSACGWELEASGYFHSLCSPDPPIDKPHPYPIWPDCPLSQSTFNLRVYTTRRRGDYSFYPAPQINSHLHYFVNILVVSTAGETHSPSYRCRRRLNLGSSRSRSRQQAEREVSTKTCQQHRAQTNLSNL